MTLFDDQPERAPVRRLSLVRLSAEIARSLSSIGKVAVEGEVHQPKSRPNGRMYFTLKDRAAQVSVTVPAARTKRAWVVDGQRVQVTGALSWDNSWGRMQLVADEVVPVGEGAVAAMIAEARGPGCGPTACSTGPGGGCPGCPSPSAWCAARRRRCGRTSSRWSPPASPATRWCSAR